MIKNIFILSFTLFTVFIYGQEISFQENNNRAARSLEQSLNKNGDSLILKTKTNKKVIRQVDIFNEDYMRSIDVNGNTSKIDLRTLPKGKFIVQARLGRKRIIMYLVKNESTVLKLEDSELNVNMDSKIAATVRQDKNLDDSSLSQKQKSIKKSIKESKKKRAGFWVVYETNTSLGSSKSMSFASEEEVSRMIAKNKLELSTEIAKNNTLLVYEVYDTSKFIRKQLKKPKYFKSSKSKVFNVKPYYSSANSDTIN